MELDKGNKMKSENFRKVVYALLNSNMHSEASNITVHGAMGVSEEAGEILGMVKKLLWYGKKLDESLMLEEMGDLLHYLTMLCNERDWTLEDLMETNAAKLKIRYPNGYNDITAIVRDKEAERKIFTDFLKGIR